VPFERKRATVVTAITLVADAEALAALKIFAAGLVTVTAPELVLAFWMISSRSVPVAAGIVAAVAAVLPEKITNRVETACEVVVILEGATSPVAKSETPTVVPSEDWMHKALPRNPIRLAPFFLQRNNPVPSAFSGSCSENNFIVLLNPILIKTPPQMGLRRGNTYFA